MADRNRTIVKYSLAFKQKVVNEIEYLLKKYKAKKIKFLEDNFFTSKKRR